MSGRGSRRLAASANTATARTIRLIDRSSDRLAAEGGANWLRMIMTMSPQETVPVQARHLRQRSIIANPA